MKTILVIDDDFAMRRGIAFLLKREGYEVLEAEDEVRALALLCGRFIDLSIVDLFLAGKNGLDLADKIKRSRPHCKLLIVTAYGEHVRAMQARELYKEYFLEKSDIEKVLIKKVHKILDDAFENSETYKSDDR